MTVTCTEEVERLKDFVKSAHIAALLTKIITTHRSLTTTMTYDINQQCHRSRPAEVCEKKKEEKRKEKKRKERKMIPERLSPKSILAQDLEWFLQHRVPHRPQLDGKSAERPYWSCHQPQASQTQNPERRKVRLKGRKKTQRPWSQRQVWGGQRLKA